MSDISKGYEPDDIFTGMDAITGLKRKQPSDGFIADQI